MSGRRFARTALVLMYVLSNMTRHGRSYKLCRSSMKPWRPQDSQWFDFDVFYLTGDVQLLCEMHSRLLVCPFLFQLLHVE